MIMATPKNKTQAAETKSAGDKVAILLAALLTKDMQNMAEKVRVLAPVGLTTAEIAAACGTGENVVRARLADLNKQKKPTENPN